MDQFELFQHDFVKSNYDNEDYTLIGKGSYANVYKVKRKNQNIYVALKVSLIEKTDDNDFELQYIEIIALNKLNKSKENLVPQCFRHQIDKDKIFIEMEFCPLSTLDNYLSKHDKLSDIDMKELIEKMALILSAAHRSNIANLDIKPQNILLKSKKKKSFHFYYQVSEHKLTFLLCDWGSAQIISQDKQIKFYGSNRYNEIKQTRANTLMSTFNFESPESIKQETMRYLLDKIDIFALGRMLLLCAGVTLEQIPFDVIRDEQKFNEYHQNIISKAKIEEFYSKQFENTLKNFLEYDPLKRMSANEILQKLSGRQKSKITLLQNNKKQQQENIQNNIEDNNSQQNNMPAKLNENQFLEIQKRLKILFNINNLQQIKDQLQENLDQLRQLGQQWLSHIQQCVNKDQPWGAVGWPTLFEFVKGISAQTVDDTFNRKNKTPYNNDLQGWIQRLKNKHQEIQCSECQNFILSVINIFEYRQAELEIHEYTQGIIKMLSKIQKDYQNFNPNFMEFFQQIKKFFKLLIQDQQKEEQLEIMKQILKHPSGYIILEAFNIDTDLQIKNDLQVNLNLNFDIEKIKQFIEQSDRYLAY